MCCAIEYPDLSQKMGVTRERLFNCSVREGKSKRKVELDSKTESEKNQTTSPQDSKIQEIATDLGARPKVPTIIISESDGTEKKEQKKKRKWKSVSLSECGFNLSLFPRPSRPEMIDPKEEAAIIEKIENEIEDYYNVVKKYKDLDTDNTELFEGGCKADDKLARPDRDRKIQKAGKQVKHKNCSSVKNNKGRKKLYIHHRLFKLINLEEKRLDCHLPSQSKYRENDLSNNKNTNETKSRLKPHQPVPSRRPGPVQNLRFALQETNAATDLASSLVSVLINLQHRELTPEDYEVLCQLDESVAPITIDKSLLENFETDVVNESTAGDICPVCMDMYEVGDNRKFLPCNHVFHAKCIDMWLENSSRNCPIDGLPVDEKS